MPETIAGSGQLVAFSCAFWVAVGRFRGAEQGRFVLGLALGAGFAHLGWLALHADRVMSADELLGSPLRGFSVLFVPLGPAICACTMRGASRRWRFAEHSVRALPLALACARLGCVMVGCCGGVRLGDEAAALLAFAGADPYPNVTHPAALYEAVGCLALHRAMARGEVHSVGRHAERRAESGAVALFAVGLGAIRLAVEPWRATPPLGEPWIPIEAIAALWVCLGVGVAWSGSCWAGAVVLRGGLQRMTRSSAR